MDRRRSRQALLVVALVAVAWQSLIPSDEVLVRTSYDKVGHALIYAVLTALAALAMTRPRFWPAWLGILAFGLLLEVAQGLTGFRSFELFDLVADAIGAALGAAVIIVVERRRQRTTT